MLNWLKALLELLEFESGVEIRTLTQLHSKKMLECSDGDNVGETKQLKQKLHEYYNHIFSVNTQGHEDVVCFRNVVEYITNEKFFKNSIEDKAEWVVQTVVKNLHEVLEKHYDYKSYPTN